MSPPPVTVLMPARDGTYLREAVETLQAQSFDAFDLLVVDDGLSAGHRAWLDGAAGRDPRIQVVPHDGAPGLAAVLNTGLARIASPLVARADADDRYAPDRLARQVAEFDRRSDLVGLSCGYHRITEDGARVLTHRPVTGAAIIRFRAMFSNSLLHPGIVLRRAAVARVGGYDPAYWTAQDSDLWARLMAAGGALDNLPDPLVEWREHGGSVLSKRGPEGKALSLTVSRRLQEAYLDRALEPQTVAAAVETWRSYSPLPFDTLRRGAAHLARILDAARRQEEAEVIRDFERKMAASFLRQARFALRRKPGTALRLGARAMAWRQGRPSERDAA